MFRTLLCRLGVHYVWQIEERRVCQRCGAAWDDWAARPTASPAAPATALDTLSAPKPADKADAA